MCVPAGAYSVYGRRATRAFRRSSALGWRRLRRQEVMQKPRHVAGVCGGGAVPALRLEDSDVALKCVEAIAVAFFRFPGLSGKILDR